MSRSNNTDIKNPATKFFTWNGEHGGFDWYKKDTKEKIHCPLPFSFLVLDTLSTIKGGMEVSGKYSGYWANEVRNIKNDILTVRDKNGICATGTYNDIKTNPACNGAKYAQSVYIAYKGDEGLEIANIQMLGSALSAWIEFAKTNDIMKGAILVKEAIDKKKGITKYKEPVFSKIDTTAGTDEVANDLDKELQEYLSKYFNAKKAEVIQQETHNVATEEGKGEYATEADLKNVPPDDLPF